jgi:hypothetical protein
MPRTSSNILAAVVAVLLTAVTFQQCVTVPASAAEIAGSQLA